MTKTISVWFALYYLTETEGLRWRDADYIARNIIKAVKGEPIGKGYFELMINGQARRFDQKNVGEFMPHLYGAVAKRMSGLVTGNFTIVPIPNSGASAKDRAEFDTLKQARAIARSLDARAKVVPALRWKQPKPQAHKGGGRNPQIHFDNLVVVERPVAPVIIYDDVLTSGSQLIACYRKLAAAGAEAVCGVTIGRTTKLQHENPLSWREEAVDVEQRQIDFDTLFRPR